LALYIDDKNTCHTDDALKDVPKPLADEYKKYKICKIGFDKLKDGDVVNALNDALKKWAETERASSGKLEKESTDAEKDYKPEEAAAKKAARDEKAAEETTHERNRDAIKNNPNLNEADKNKKNGEEIDRHRKADGAIIKKESDAEAAARKKRDDRIKKFKDALPKPPDLSITCAPDTKECGEKPCKVASVSDVGDKDKPQVIVSYPDIKTVAGLSPKHLYFCTCGPK
jgi:hypothetical protein